MVDARYAQARMTLRQWRVNVLSIRQEDLVDRLRMAGVKATLSAVSLWASGKRSPRVTTRAGVAKALGIQPWQIIWADDPATEEQPVAA